MSGKNIASSSALAIIMILQSFVACQEKNSNDAMETYRLWSGELPTKDVTVINGKFWQSAHWSKEYVVYLELKASLLWRQEFFRQNHLVATGDPANIPSDAPVWFTPNSKFKVLKQPGFNQGSLYFEDEASGKIFIYEIQL